MFLFCNSKTSEYDFVVHNFTWFFSDTRLFYEDETTPYYSFTPITEKTEQVKLFAKAIIEQCDKNLVCSNVPYKCMTNGTFLVELSKLKSPKVVVADRLVFFSEQLKFQIIFLLFKLSYETSWKSWRWCLSHYYGLQASILFRF